MEIVKINTYITEVPLENEWKISLYSASTRKHAIVEIVTKDGTRGYGEASPSPAFMGETAETIKFIIDNYLSKEIVGRSIFETEKINEIMEETIYSQMSAKSAVDIAVYDALSKHLNTPLYNLIGGKYRESIPLTYVIGMKDESSMIQEAKDTIAAGYKCIKLKVGRDIKKDIKVIEKIYQLIKQSHCEILIRLDGNQGYSVSDAKLLLKSVEGKVPIESFEQPIRKWDLIGMSEIKRHTSIPIMADEAVFNLHDAYNVIKMDAADIVNLKICKVGGITGAKKIAGILEAAGLKCVIGSNLELGIGMAASAHVAVSTPNVSMHNDFICGGYLHSEDITDSKFYDVVENGEIKIWDSFGLGFNPKAEIIEES